MFEIGQRSDVRQYAFVVVSFTLVQPAQRLYDQLVVKLKYQKKKKKDETNISARIQSRRVGHVRYINIVLTRTFDSVSS